METAGNWQNPGGCRLGYYGFGVNRTPVAFAVPGGTQIVNPSSDNFSAWYVQATWTLTGESRAYNPATGAFTPPKVAHPLTLNGDGFGAWELALRYSDTNLNDRTGDTANVITAASGATRTYDFYNTVRGGDQRILTAGINWYPNNAIRFALNYELIQNNIATGHVPECPDRDHRGRHRHHGSRHSRRQCRPECLGRGAQGPAVLLNFGAEHETHILSSCTGAAAIFAATSAHAAKRPRAADQGRATNPTRELYKDLGDGFAKQWKADTVTVNTSNGGSGAQARAVIDGLQADIVTLALAADIDAIAKNAKLLPPDWQKRLPESSTPYTSTIVFLVRKGNPWKIKDWNDLVKPGIQVVTPNPKTSGGARWAYLAAWAYAEKAPGGDAGKAKALSPTSAHHVPVLDSGARASTITFTKRGIGDVLLSWGERSPSASSRKPPASRRSPGPSRSILAEPPVALLDKNVDRHGTRKVAEAFLNYLYTPEAQEIEARDFYRPRDPAAAAKYKDQFPAIPLATVENDFGGWEKAQATHFADGGVFDQIYQPGK